VNHSTDTSQFSQNSHFYSTVTDNNISCINHYDVRFTQQLNRNKSNAMNILECVQLRHEVCCGSTLDETLNRSQDCLCLQQVTFTQTDDNRQANHQLSADNFCYANDITIKLAEHYQKVYMLVMRITRKELAAAEYQLQ